MSIKILQVGLGPLGVKMAKFIAEREGYRTVGAIEKSVNLVGKDLGRMCNSNVNGVIISDDFDAVINKTNPDVALLTTVSDMERITPQIEHLVSRGLPVVTTCEELSFPWDTNPELANRINIAAQKEKVAVVSTGVNPGFLMDTLPVTLTAVCQDVSKIEVNRFQDARFRRIPFQKKIGAGLTLDEFEERKQNGSLRHVGLTESMQFIAHSLGWSLDHTEDNIYPVIAEQRIETDDLIIEAGHATGVKQVGRGLTNGEEKITLVFQAAVGEPSSYDEVKVTGNPDIYSRIEGGVNGDIATCAITINTIPALLKSGPGLKTMAEIPTVSFSSNPALVEI
ncbi:MAG: dihydrodipicolinate reductase [Bacteroidota bacterium]